MRLVSWICLAVSSAAAAESGRAQCGEWTAGFGQPKLRDVYCQLVHDDGSGQKLYVGGSFTSVGDAPIAFLATWDGSTWSAVGAGIGGAVRALQVWDDGTGPALYAGGTFTTAGGTAASRLARWDGTSWTEVGGGVDHYVSAFAIHDDGTGEALFLAGRFDNVGGLPSNRWAGWDGANWKTFTDGPGTDEINALASFDSGSGAELYLAGTFDEFGNVPFEHVVRWNGASIQDVSGGVDDWVEAMVVHDDGHGSALFLGGRFKTAGGSFALSVARWDGATWSDLELGVGPATSTSGAPVDALAVIDDGSFGSPRLYVGGEFTIAGPVYSDNVAIWDGYTWESTGTLGQGLVAKRVDSIAAYDGGGGFRLHVGGWLQQAGGVTIDGYALWDRTDWIAPFESGALDDHVETLAAVDLPSGQFLAVGGSFRSSAATPALEHVGLWNGAEWTPLGAGFESHPSTFASFDTGSGASLYAGGGDLKSGGIDVGPLARWDGSTWHAIGGISQGGINELVEFDADGGGPQPPLLVAVGSLVVTSNPAAPRVAAWDGASWSTFAQGFGQGSLVTAAVYDSGSGPELYVAGNFQVAGVKLANSIARWDGADWQPVGAGVGGGVDGWIYDMTVWDDGTGPKLVAVGTFSTAGGTPAPNVAIWDGGSWSGLLAQPMPKAPDLVEAYDDGGGGSELLVLGGGIFQVAGVPVSKIAAWDGSSWTGFDGGLELDAKALAVFDDGYSGQPSLYFGGAFRFAGSVESKYIARWAGCSSYTYCTAKVNSLGCPPTMESVGVPRISSSSGFLVRATQVRNKKSGLLFYGVSGPSAAPFQGGTLCVATPLKRTGAISSGGSPTGNDCTGVFELDMNAFAAGLLGGTPLPALSVPGTRTYCQWWGRDPGFPPPQNTTLSDGLSYVIGL